MSNDDLTAFLNARLDEDERYLKSNAHHLWTERPLREVEAKRAIIDLAARTDEWTRGSAGATAGYAALVVKDSLRALAAIWSDHPDYRPEWAS